MSAVKFWSKIWKLNRFRIYQLFQFGSLASVVVMQFSVINELNKYASLGSTIYQLATVQHDLITFQLICDNLTWL